jgi:hypothetical protein
VQDVAGIESVTNVVFERRHPEPVALDRDLPAARLYLADLGDVALSGTVGEETCDLFEHGLA